MTQREAIEALKAMNEAFVGPELIARALGMSESVLRKHVRDGHYKISQADVCGNRVRFARKDFLQQIGEIPVELPERTDSDRLEDIIRLLDELCDMIHAMVGAPNEKTASCGRS